MSTLSQHIQTVNHPVSQPVTFVNDSFWSLLVLASLAAATLVGIQHLF